MIPQKTKVENILKFPKPENKKQVRRFLGVIGYYSRFIKNFAEIASPLFALTGNKVKFEWKDIHNEAFTILQNYLNDLPSLCPFTPGLPIRLECDASNLGV